jgi:hypothetical protein
MPESSTAILIPRPVPFRRKVRASSSVGHVFTHSAIQRSNALTIGSRAQCLDFIGQPADPCRIVLQKIK